MNKLNLIIVSLFALAIVSLLGYANPVLALTPTPTTKPDTQINQLKDRIASRVAQLKLVDRRGLIGIVTEVTASQITINDIHNTTRFADVDDLTKFSSPSAKGAFGISDISKGSKVGILGLYNKQSRRILSRFVDVMIFPQTLHGAISSVDKEEFVINVVSQDGTTTAIEVANITRTISYDTNAQGTKSGFSKMKIGEHVIVIGFPSKTDQDRILASRILLFPDVPKNPNIKVDLKITPSPTSPVKP